MPSVFGAVLALLVAGAGWVPASEIMAAQAMPGVVTLPVRGFKQVMLTLMLDTRQLRGTSGRLAGARRRDQHRGDRDGAGPQLRDSPSMGSSGSSRGS
jgi:hypothetical protein